MRYKVGDKVLNEQDLIFLFNPYHKEEYRKYLISTVTEANDEYFTIYKPSRGFTSAIEEGKSAGINEYMVFKQSNGKTICWASQTRILHLVNDKNYIVNKIKRIGRNSFLEDEDFLLKKIESTKLILQNKKEQYESDLIKNLSLIKWGD